MQILNDGGLSEYVGLKFMLPEKDYLVEFNSMLSGNKSEKKSEVKAAHMPFDHETFGGKMLFF